MIRNSRFYFSLAVLFSVITISAALPAQDQLQDQQPPSHQERAKAINIVRLINTAEVTYYMGSRKGTVSNHARYATWDDLFTSGAVPSAQDLSGMFKDLQLSAGQEIIPGYHLDLLVSPDGQSYSIALHDKKDGDGLYSVFSDPTGIIYQGAPLQ
jgi:hypothetical protein